MTLMNAIKQPVGQNGVESSTELESLVKNIRQIYISFSGKADADVIIFYKSNSSGVTKPWIIRVDSHEYADVSVISAATGLFKMLRQKLTEKIASDERQIAELKKALGTLDN